MREIVLDTETTGLDPKQGHKIVEIACLELINHVPTGQTFHAYINPKREVPEQAVAVHGLTYEFLKEHMTFDAIVSSFLDFIQTDPLVIHNAAFDMKFLNAELVAIRLPELEMSRAIDTLLMARRKFPNSPASLDALCRKFSIDNSKRDLHGALIDTQLLADVYLELLGGRQPDLIFEEKKVEAKVIQHIEIRREHKKPRSFPASEEELGLHQELLKKINNSCWNG